MFSEVLWPACHNNLKTKKNKDGTGTVDGRNPAHGEYPLVSRVSCI